MPFAEVLHLSPRDVDQLTVQEFEHFVSELEKVKARDEAERREAERLKQPQR